MPPILFFSPRLDASSDIIKALKEIRVNVQSTNLCGIYDFLLHPKFKILWIDVTKALQPIQMIEPQLDDMKQHRDYSLVIFEKNGLTASKLAPIQKEVVLLRGIPFIPVTNAKGAASLLKRKIDGVEGIITFGLRPCNDATVEKLCQCLGISNNVAKNLLSKFKSMRRISQATEAEISQVDGIGGQSAHRLYELIRAASSHERFASIATMKQ